MNNEDYEEIDKKSAKQLHTICEDVMWIINDAHICLSDFFNVIGNILMSNINPQNREDFEDDLNILIRNHLHIKREIEQNE